MLHVAARSASCIERSFICCSGNMQLCPAGEIATIGKQDAKIAKAL